MSVNADATLRIGSKVLAHRSWSSPGCGPTDKTDTTTGGDGGDGGVDKVVTHRLTVVASVGTRGTDPNLTSSQQQGLSIEAFHLVTNYSTMNNMSYQRPQGTAPGHTLSQSFSYKVAPTKNTTINLSLTVGVPGGSLVPVTVVHPATHVPGDPLDEFRYALGSADDTLALDVDYGSGPDGTVGWLVIATVKP
ncbi:MAG: hypothetical protein ABIR83_09890 [Nakamurella sp.]